MQHINHPYHVRQLEEAKGTFYIGDLVTEVQRRRRLEEAVLVGYPYYEIGWRITPKPPSPRTAKIGH